MVSRRRRNIPARTTRRNSRRSSNLRRQLALIAHRVPTKSRIPRDPLPSVPGFDYTVRVPFNVRMFWTDAKTSDSFKVYLPGNPLTSGSIYLNARNTNNGTASSRAYWLDYSEVFAAAYMRATGADIRSASSGTKASLDFALVSVKVWGPVSASASMALRCDGDSTVSGFSGADNPGRNHRAALACTWPSIGWRLITASDGSNPAVLVNLVNINFMQFAPQAAGTEFGISTGIDMGEVQVTVRIRYKLSASVVAGQLSNTKGATTFVSDEDAVR